MVDTNPCCFRIGWGSRMVPCCLSIVSCEEYEEHLKQNQMLLGGSIGIADHCPNDAEEAGSLLTKVTKSTLDHDLPGGTFRF